MVVRPRRPVLSWCRGRFVFVAAATVAPMRAPYRALGDPTTPELDKTPDHGQVFGSGCAGRGRLLPLDASPQKRPGIARGYRGTCGGPRALVSFSDTPGPFSSPDDGPGPKAPPGVIPFPAPGVGDGPAGDVWARPRTSHMRGWTHCGV